MPKNCIRFGIENSGKISDSWNLFTEKGKNKSDFYLVHRNLCGEFKASFHQSGKNHLSFSRNFISKNKELEKKNNGRFLNQWEGHKQLGNNYELVIKVFIPYITATNQKIKISKDIFFAKTINNKDYNAIEFTVIIPKYKLANNIWPGKKLMKTKLAGMFILENGKQVYCVYRPLKLDINISSNYKAYPLKDKDEKDLKKDLKGVVFASQEDGVYAFLQTLIK